MTNSNIKTVRVHGGVSDKERVNLDDITITDANGAEMRQTARYAALEFSEEAILKDGRTCKVVYGFSQEELVGTQTEDLPFDAEHIVYIAIDDEFWGLPAPQTDHL